MELYFSPLTCSLAARIAIHQYGHQATFVEVDRFTKDLVDQGADYRDVHSMGTVPALRTDDGRLLTEVAAVLQHLAGDDARAGAERTEVQRWLSFVGTELHKGTFFPIFDVAAPDEARRYAAQKAEARLAYLEQHLEGREYLTEDLSVADMYLYTVLNWASASPVSLEPYPAIRAYFERMRGLPAVKRAFTEEMPLYRAMMARLAARTEGSTT